MSGPYGDEPWTFRDIFWALILPALVVGVLLAATYYLGGAALECARDPH